MTDLAAWLLAQIADDEQEARQVIIKAPAPWKISEYNEIADANGKGIVTSGDYGSPWMQDYVDDHIARWDPARVLAECDTKRRIIAEHTPTQGWTLEPFQPGAVCETCCDTSNAGDREGEWPCRTLRLLALPYADRPGYREEWRA